MTLDEDAAAARTLLAALARILDYPGAVPIIEALPSNSECFDDPRVPALLRIYLLGLFPRAALAREDRITDLAMDPFN